MHIPSWVSPVASAAVCTTLGVTNYLRVQTYSGMIARVQEQVSSCSPKLAEQFAHYSSVALERISDTVSQQAACAISALQWNVKISSYLAIAEVGTAALIIALVATRRFC
jgi:hypothetical protein